MHATETEPNGGIVAATVAAGAGCAALGLLTVASAASSEFADLLTLYAPSGPLTGKATVASIIYVIVWVNLHFRLRDRAQPLPGLPADHGPADHRPDRHLPAGLPAVPADLAPTGLTGSR